jgi:transposase
MLQRDKEPSYSERLCSMNPNIDQNLLDLKNFCRKSSGGMKIMRCIFIIMRKIGLKEKTISKILDFCDRTKDKCWNRYLEKGLAGLEDLDRSGRPPKINSNQEKEIFEFVKSSANEESTLKITTIHKIKEEIYNKFNLDPHNPLLHYYHLACLSMPIANTTLLTTSLNA